jgi:hypothetical protein
VSQENDQPDALDTMIAQCRPRTGAAEDSLEDFLRLFDAPSTAPIDPVVLSAGKDHQRASDTHQAIHQFDSSGVSSSIFQCSLKLPSALVSFFGLYRKVS